jgi:hypothetical protein
MHTTASSPALETLPPPERIRAQLAERLREVRLLRRLLRVSEELPRRNAGEESEASQ